ncbi:hypothetical protein O6H91_Y417400 [Diphasiastrum complanatum]|nr:hypothetical protein O6H91_Y417400 [Diphasiastrum complanatum]
MSVFSVTALDRLIEPTDKGAPSRPANEKGPVREKRPLYSYSAYSPAAVNSNRPRSPSPSSFSSSPFIVNFKGRRAIRQEVQKPTLEHGAQSGSAQILDVERDSTGRKPKVTPSAESSQEDNGKEGVHSQMNKLDSDAVKTESGHMKSHSRCSPGNLSAEKDFSKLGKHEPLEYPVQVPKSDEGASDSTASGDEFFDAPESPASGSSIGDELPYDGTRTTNLDKLDELEADVEQCGSAQRALLTLKQQHEAVLEKLFLSGISLTPSHNQIIGRSSADLLDLSDQIIQRIEVARLVTCAVARGAAKAEAEKELALIIDSKNREISRLRDKLLYCETINHEMSQRNQESIEIARRRRRERQRRLRLTIGWSSHNSMLEHVCYSFV